MKLAKVLLSCCFVLSLLPACGVSLNGTSEINSARVSPNSATPQLIFENFRECIISGALSSHSKHFQQIKEKCFEEQLRQCQTQSSDESELCVREFRALSENILKNAKFVECDSGYCTLVFWAVGRENFCHELFLHIVRWIWFAIACVHFRKGLVSYTFHPQIIHEP